MIIISLECILDGCRSCRWHSGKLKRFFFLQTTLCNKNNFIRVSSLHELPSLPSCQASSLQYVPLLSFPAWIPFRV
jgi:hypothetical protein